MSKADKNDAQESVSEPRVYELGFLVVPSLTDEKLTDAVDSLRAVIDKAGGSIIAEGAPALRELAYEMSKMVANKRSSYTSAHFGWLKFEATPEVLDEMKLELDANNDLIRYIIVKTVREDTMASMPARTFEPSAGQELAMADSGKERKVPERVPEEKVELSEEEIDEEIDKLLEEDTEETKEEKKED